MQSPNCVTVGDLVGIYPVVAPHRYDAITAVVFIQRLVNLGFGEAPTDG